MTYEDAAVLRAAARVLVHSVVAKDAVNVYLGEARVDSSNVVESLRSAAAAIEETQ